MSDRCRYIIISPVKDEEKHIETTIRAVMGQTIRPCLWVIVDDGSRDRTPTVCDSYAAKVSWIKTLRIQRDAPRQPGSAVIYAFNRGLQYLREQGIDFDFIVKLDGDLDFAPDYFERLLARFRYDRRLGIASGTIFEPNGTGWSAAKSPPYHARGAAKMVRKDCFEAIGGFVPSRGWDTIDEIRAQVRGWTTRHFPELTLYHLKPIGSGIGQLRTNLLDGEIHYLTGGGILFFILKVVHRIVYGRPFFLGSIAMLGGFLWAWLAGKKRLVSNTEARFYRQLLNQRILAALRLVRSVGKA